MHIKNREEYDVLFESSIRIVKARGHSTCNYVPYKKYTKLMTKYLIEGVIY